MRTIRLEIELTYNDENMHSGERDHEAKAWFHHNVLLEPPDRLILHSNDIGDEVGEVNVLSVAQHTATRKGQGGRVEGKQ